MSNKVTSNDIASILQRLQKKCWSKDRILAEEMGISIPEFNLLTFFYNEDSLPIKSLTIGMSVTPGRITHLVTSLEENKYIKRSLNKSDRRVVQVTLTKKGRNLVDKIQQLVNIYFSEMLASLEKTKQSELLTNLERLSDIMDTRFEEFAK